MSLNNSKCKDHALTADLARETGEYWSPTFAALWDVRQRWGSNSCREIEVNLIAKFKRDVGLEREGVTILCAINFAWGLDIELIYLGLDQHSCLFFVACIDYWNSISVKRWNYEIIRGLETSGIEQTANHNSDNSVFLDLCLDKVYNLLGIGGVSTLLLLASTYCFGSRNIDLDLWGCQYFNITSGGDIVLEFKFHGVEWLLTISDRVTDLKIFLCSNSTRGSGERLWKSHGIDGIKATITVLVLSCNWPFSSIFRGTLKNDIWD